MGFLFDSQTMRSELEKKKTEAETHEMSVDFMLDIIATSSPRKAAEVNLLKLSKSFSHKIIDNCTRIAMNENITDEQLKSVTDYLEMVLTGFNTFMEQFESTIKKENPHSSGN